MVELALRTQGPGADPLIAAQLTSFKFKIAVK